MKTNFFTTLKPLLNTGLNLTITIKAQGEELVVATLPKHTALQDYDAANRIKPLVITETAENLDEGFFETITQPLEKVNTTADSVKSFLDELSKAEPEIQSEAKKDKGSKAKPEPTKAKEKPGAEAAPVKNLADVTRKVVDEHCSKALAMIAQDDLKGAKKEIEMAHKQIKAASLTETEENELKAKVDGAEANLQEAEAKLKQAELEAKTKADFESSERQFKSLNFPEGAKFAKKVKAVWPEHPGLKTLLDGIADKLGQATVDQLMR